MMMHSLDRKAVFLLVVLSVFLASCEQRINTPSNPMVNSTPVPAKKVLGSFYPIEGTHYQLASISAVPEEREDVYDFSRLLSEGRSDYGVYNYVFLDVEAETVYPLLPNNETLIYSTQGYPLPKDTDVEKVPVAWWLYTLIKEDTNEDKEFSYLDKKTLAVSDVGGKGYAEVITGVDQILGDAFKAGDVLLIIYRAGDKNFLAHIDLAARKVTKTTELPSFGEDVK